TQRYTLPYPTLFRSSQSSRRPPRGSLCVPPRPSPQGRSRPANHPRPPPRRRAGLCPVLPGDLPHRQATLRPRAAAPRFHPATPASPLLLLPRCRLRPDVPPLADLVPLHLPGYHNGPGLPGPQIPPRGRRLCAPRHRLPPPRRPPPAPPPGGPLRAPPRGRAPDPLGPPRQPAAETTLAAGPELLL